MSETSKLKQIFFAVISDGVPRRSFYVALVVGTILNLINQGDALLGNASVNWLKIIFTYFVPYGVCTYGAVYTQLKRGVFDGPKESRDAAYR